MPDDTIDKQIGKRVQMARNGRRVSAQTLAKSLDLSYQQLRKYETGQNRISVSVLFRVSRILGVDIDYFFRGLEPRKPELADPTHDQDPSVAAALKRVRDPDVRRKLAELIDALERSQRG